MKSVALATLMLGFSACQASSGVASQGAGPGAGTPGDPMEEMPVAERLEQHEWLQQLVGEWTATSTAAMEPGVEPMVIELTESVRSMGGLWTVAEGRADFGGMSMSTMMTLGYDPRREAFVGTWVDTSQSHMWSYVGTLDAPRRILTLSSEGPSFSDPTKTANYRDAIEIKDRDHRVLTSSVQGDDGAWTTYMTAEYRRKSP